MIKLTERERILRTYRRQEIDRIPMVDSAWRGTEKRWQREGMPENVSWEDHFDFDRMIRINPDNSPRFERRIIEQNERYRIETTPWGANEAYQLKLGGEMQQRFLLCYDNCIVEIDFDWDWQLTSEQMKIVAEKLGR